MSKAEAYPVDRARAEAAPARVVPDPDIAAPGSAIAAHATPARHIITQQSAVALTYAGDETAPRVVAKGRGLVAQAIIARAHQHGVYVHESRELVAMLMQIDMDQRIPHELYRAVAELLVWVYRLEHDAPASAAAEYAKIRANREKRSREML